MRLEKIPQFSANFWNLVRIQLMYIFNHSAYIVFQQILHKNTSNSKACSLLRVNYLYHQNEAAFFVTNISKNIRSDGAEKA